MTDETPDEELSPQDPETAAKVQAMLDGRIEEQVQEAKSQAAEVPPKERKETERNTTYDQENFTQNAMFSWSLNLPGLETITVDDTEKALYIKAVVNDVPVKFDIMLEMGDDSIGNITATFRTLNNYETDLVFQAIEEDRKAGVITGHHQLATRLQYYAGALQLEKFQGTNMNHLEFKEAGIVVDDVATLRDFVTKFVGRMNWARWQAVLQCLRIFETKIKICNDAALNGDFWTPPGADS